MIDNFLKYRVHSDFVNLYTVRFFDSLYRKLCSNMIENGFLCENNVSFYSVVPEWNKTANFLLYVRPFCIFEQII